MLCSLESFSQGNSYYYLAKFVLSNINQLLHQVVLQSCSQLIAHFASIGYAFI